MDGLSLKAYPCALCGAAESKRVLRKRGVAIPMEFTVVACRSCGHVRVDPRVPDERLDELYDAAYYRGEGFDRTVHYDAETTPAARAESNAIIDTVVEARGRSLAGARWLDVGCGTGGLLEEAQRRGAQAFGTDSSAAAIAACTKKGLSLLGEAEVTAQEGTFDVVSAIEVIEHVPDPRALLSFLRSCAKIGGIVFVRTGNWNLVRRERGTPYVMPEGHIQYFTPDVMRRLFAEVSLREVDAHNRMWFADRILGGRLQKVPGLLPALGKIARRVTPGLAPFPVGMRTI